MELFRGARITEFCESNALSIGARLGLFIKVCQAIQHAQQKGIVHRDIKPSNILVGLHDGEPVPQVTDFDAETLAVKNQLADSYGALKRSAEALRLREEVLDLLLQNEGPGRPEVITAMGQAAVAFEQAGKWDQALELRQKLVDRHREKDGPRYLQTLAGTTPLGRCLRIRRPW